MHVNVHTKMSTLSHIVIKICNQSSDKDHTHSTKTTDYRVMQIRTMLTYDTQTRIW